MRGWEVRHCGHPTANWPYHLTDPEAPNDVIVTHNGQGFRRLIDAMAAVEMIGGGMMIATAEGCNPGTRRVIPAGEVSHV